MTKRNKKATDKKSVTKEFPVTEISRSSNIIGGYGSNGAKPRPFNYDTAVRKLYSWIYAASMLNANTFASQRLRFYTRVKNGKTPIFSTRALSKERRDYLSGESKYTPSNIVSTKLAEWSSNDWVEVTEPHPVLTVRSRVNPEMNGYNFSKLKSLYMQLTGNSYEIPVINEALGRPVATYIVPSQWVEVVPSKGNESYFIDGYAIGCGLQKTIFSREQVIHYRQANPTDDIYYYGYGNLQAVWSALGLHEAKRQEDIAKKENYSRPDWLIGTRTPVGQEQMDRLSADLRKQIRGTNKAGNFAALGFDFRAEALNLPDNVLGDPDRIVEEIASVFGVPVSKLLANHGLAGGQAESGDANYLRDTVLPMLRNDEEELNQSWLPLFSDLNPDDCCLAYDNPIVKDRDFELRKSLELFKAGIITKNQALVANGYPEVEEDTEDNNE